MHNIAVIVSNILHSSSLSLTFLPSFIHLLLFFELFLLPAFSAPEGFLISIFSCPLAEDMNMAL